MLTNSDKAVLDAAIDLAYHTTDFEFVAFALVNKDPMAKLYGLKQIDTKGSRGYKGDGGSVRYTFFLLPENDEADREMWHARMEDLAIDYVNQRTVVEPTALASMRKNLRGMVLQKKKTMRRSG